MSSQFRYPNGVAPYSPGLLQPWDNPAHFMNNPNGVAPIQTVNRFRVVRPPNIRRTQPFQGWRTCGGPSPGLPQPWALRRNPFGIQATTPQKIPVSMTPRTDGPVPEGQHENSPPFQGWVSITNTPSPEGTAERATTGIIPLSGASIVPSGRTSLFNSNPALKRRAIVTRPAGTNTRPLPLRPGLRPTERFSRFHA